jgi:RNA recognition motif-containing protein
MPPLLLSNISHKCQERELLEWVESKGFPVTSVSLVRDLVAGVSPAFGYVTLHNPSENPGAIRRLNGEIFMGRVVRVENCPWEDAPRRGHTGVDTAATPMVRFGS